VHFTYAKEEMVMAGIACCRLVPALLLFLSAAVAAPPSQAQQEPRLIQGFTSYSDFPKDASWRQDVPQVQTIFIDSTADGSRQPALWYDSGSDRPKPLLIVLHSWSFDYTQPVSIPFGLWSVQNDWVFIHPDYRGKYDNPEATASELAIQDILDAREYALANANIDPQRIYLTGFSGGAMTALVLAGRHPDQWSAVSAWVPIYNLNDWYWYNITENPEMHYLGNIVDSCGGVPRPGSAAAEECRRRSPVAYLKNTRNQNLPILLAVGIEDDIVPPGQALLAFNDLAEPADRFSIKDILFINQNNRLPEHLSGDFSDGLYEDAGKPLLFTKSSASVTLVFFAGGHDVLFNPALVWLYRQ
jgi:acetyl esterase/lipase